MKNELETRKRLIRFNEETYLENLRRHFIYHREQSRVLKKKRKNDTSIQIDRFRFRLRKSKERSIYVCHSQCMFLFRKFCFHEDIFYERNRKTKTNLRMISGNGHVYKNREDEEPRVTHRVGEEPKERKKSRNTKREVRRRCIRPMKKISNSEATKCIASSSRNDHPLKKHRSTRDTSALSLLVLRLFKAQSDGGKHVR